MVVAVAAAVMPMSVTIATMERMRAERREYYDHGCKRASLPHATVAARDVGERELQRCSAATSCHAQFAACGRKTC